MSHERIKSKSFSARKGIPKIGECHAISFSPIVCWHQMIENSFKRCFLIYLRPPSSVPKSKVGMQIGLVSILQAFCKILAMQ